MMKRLLIFSVVSALGFLSSCNGPQETASATATLEGTIVYRERIMLPEDAQFIVQLVDANRMDVAALVLASDTFSASAPPMAFSLTYDPARIKEGLRYELNARIQHGGELKMINDASSVARFDGSSHEVLVRSSAVPSYSSYIPSDFQARGNEPYWKLTVDFERGLMLHRMDMEPISTPMPERTFDSETRELVLDARTESHHLVVRIGEKNCQDTMADESYPYMVTVAVDGEDLYSGCGHLMDETRTLKGNWVLTEMAEGDLSTAPKSPSLSLDMLFGRYSATDGCNGIGGELSMKPSTLLFKPGFSTEMYCGNDFDVQFAKLFLDVDGYQIVGEELQLFRENTRVLTYKPEPLGLDRVERDLHDIWTAYSIGSTPIPRGIEAPRIEFYPAEGRVSGYTSCNHFNGGMESGIGEVRFDEHMAVTKRYCEGSVEKTFLTAISQVSAYRRDGQQLFLLDESGKTLLSLQKTD